MHHHGAARLEQGEGGGEIAGRGRISVERVDQHEVEAAAIDLDRGQRGADVGAGAAIVDGEPVGVIGRAAIHQPPAVIEAACVDRA